MYMTVGLTIRFYMQHQKHNTLKKKADKSNFIKIKNSIRYVGSKNE